MDLYAFFHRKDEKIRSQHCVVEKVVELSESEYARFYQSPLAEYNFISKHRGAMRQDADGTRHCWCWEKTRRMVSSLTQKAMTMPATMLFFPRPASFISWISTLQ